MSEILMTTKIMFYEVYVIPLPAFISIALLLTGIRGIQKAAINIASISIRFGNSFCLTLSQLFLFLSCTRFVAQCGQVAHARSKLNLYQEGVSTNRVLATTEVEDRLKANLWRSERNFWICVLGVGGWLVFVRIIQVMEKLWKKLDTSMAAHALRSESRKNIQSPASAKTTDVSSEGVESRLAQPKESQIPSKSDPKGGLVRNRLRPS